MPHVVGERGAQEFALGGRGFAGIRVAVGLWTLLQVHPARQQVGRGDTVGKGVVNLAKHRDPAVRQPFDEVHLPQRPAAIERRAGDPADRIIELAAASGAVDSIRTNVVLEVDLAVLPPHRMVELERDVDKLIAERVELVEATADDLTELVDAEMTALQLGDVDHRELEGVHVHGRSLAVQQHSVPPAKPLQKANLLPGDPI